MTPEESILEWVEDYVVTIESPRDGAVEALIELVQDAIDDEREACAVATEVWTEGRSRFRSAAEAIRARRPLK